MPWIGFGDSKAKSPSQAHARILTSFLQRKLEPAHDVDLSPNRLANFYRTCGENFDELFRNTGEHGVSFLYRTLGCYHSLQPTRNAFDTPNIPCLTDDGFVRWQTLQLLLCPDQHATIMQRAVEIYDVPRKRGGGIFPKSIPRECFPARPDTDMEKWHKFVTSQISSDNYVRRLKLSPYQSPQPESASSPGGYFARPAPTQRPSQGRRSGSRSQEELARMEAAREAARRRRSVPDIASPGGTLYSEKEAARKARSRSANRPGSGPEVHQPRQHSFGNLQSQYYPPPPQRQSHSVSANRHSSNTSVDRGDKREKRYHRNPSSGSRAETVSDSSSEASYPSPRPRTSDEDSTKRKPRWGSSIMPSFFLSNSKRRHSSDGRVPTLRNRKSPQRGESIRKYKTEGLENPPLGRFQDGPPDRTPNNVRFSNAPNTNNVPVRPQDPAYPPPVPPSSYRYSDPQAQSQPHSYPNPNAQPFKPNPPSMNYIPPTPPNVPNTPLMNTANHFEARKQGLPIRVQTVHNVNGVNGRRYPPPETRSAVEPAMMTRRDRTSSMRNPATSTVT